MRKFIALTVICSAFVLVATSDLKACGDKLLLLGGGARVSKKHPVSQPFSVLLYKSESLARGSGSSDFEAAVKRVGHKVRVARDMAEINTALKLAKFDYVVAAPVDLDSLRAPIASSLSKPVLVPMSLPAKSKEPSYVALLSGAEKAPGK